VADQDLYLDLLKRCLTGFLYPESSNQEVHADRNLPATKRRLFQFLNNRGYKIFKAVPFDAKARELGKDWPSIGYSMAGLKRLDNLQFCVESVLNEAVPGDLLEAGVWRGGSCIFMRAILKLRRVTDRVVWVADSFQGLPAPSHEADRDYDLSGFTTLAVSQAEVEAAFQTFGMLDGQVKFLKGWFKDTLPTAPVSHLAVLRMDGDLYESTMDILNALYHKVSAGGFVIVDDYHALPPCKQAVHDFRTRTRIVDPIQQIDGTGVFWKKSS
jgi:Macrocin-O-methyltransferase (TylF)